MEPYGTEDAFAGEGGDGGGGWHFGFEVGDGLAEEGRGEAHWGVGYESGTKVSDESRIIWELSKEEGVAHVVSA